MLCGEPLAKSVELLKVVWPELFKAMEPEAFVPSKKLTLPVGVPLLPLTVAVKVTVLPADDGFWEETRAVALAL